MSDTAIDATAWLPGEWEEKIAITILQDLPCGEYAIEIGIAPPHLPMLCFCTDAPQKDGFYTVGSITITAEVRQKEST